MKAIKVTKALTAKAVSMGTKVKAPLNKGRPLGSPPLTTSEKPKESMAAGLWAAPARASRETRSSVAAAGSNIHGSGDAMAKLIPSKSKIKRTTR